jgi:hypothetical protein
VTRPVSGAAQLSLIPVEAGGARLLPAPGGGDVSSPSFAAPNSLLFVRSEKGVSEVWTMQTDGSGARSLGAAGCGMPTASPSGGSFLCLEAQERRSLFVYPIKGGRGTRLYELPEGRDFVYARWNGAGDRIFAVARDRRLLTLNSSTGALLREEAIGLGGTSISSQGRLLTAALDASGEVSAYSIIRSSSDLYLASGIR